MATIKATVAALLDRHGETFAEEIGIRLDDGTPSALFQWLCAAMLYSARIESGIATRTARELRRENLRSAQTMAGSSWQSRVHALNEGGYTRYRERAATMLGRLAQESVERYRGDLRRLREQAERDPAAERRALKRFTGIGDVGVDVFCREAQAVWPELAPFADRRSLSAASALGIGDDAATLARRVDGPPALARLVAALVRCDLAGDADEILAATR